MATSSVKDCSICNEEFNEEERCPRILPCSHCLCTDCLGQLIIKNNKNCPFCRQRFQAKSATDFKINTTALDLLKYIKAMEIKLESSGKESTKSRSQMMSDLKRSSYKTCSQIFASLKSSEDRIQKAIDDNEELKRKLLDYHSQIRKDVISKLNVLQYECDMRVAYVDAEIERLKEQLKHIKEQQKTQFDIKTKLDAATKLVQLDEAIEITETFNEEAKKWLQDFKKSFQNAAKIQLDIQKNTKTLQGNLNILVDAIRTFDEQQKHTREQTSDLIIQCFRNKRLDVADLKNLNYIVRALLKAERLHAVHQLQEKNNWAKLTMSENKVLLHCIREGQMPAGVCTLEYEDVMKLTNPSSRLVFLELGVNEYSLGRLFIRLTPDSKRGQNFSALCTGEKGPSYVNSHLLRVRDKGTDFEDIVAGDYEYNNEEGGKAVVAGAGNEVGGLLHRLEGSVFGWVGAGDNQAAQFGINTRDSPNSGCDTIFGRVESGLQVLTRAISSHTNITDVKIIDSGIILDI